MSDICCPKCTSTKFYFRQDYTSFAYIDEITRDEVKAGETKDDLPHPMSALICSDCGWEGGVQQYWEAKGDPTPKVTTAPAPGAN